VTISQTIPAYVGVMPKRDGSQTPEQYSAAMDTWIAYLAPLNTPYNTFATQANALAVTVNGYRLEAESSKDAAADSATAAAQSVQELQQYANTALNFKGEWSSLTGALAVPASVFHNGFFWQLLNNLANVAASEPGVSADWALTTTSAGRVVVLPPVNISTAGRYFIAGAGDVTLPNPASLPDGQSFDFAVAVGFEPQLVTVTDGIKTKLGLTDTLVMDLSGAELVTNNGKYEV
jgi:hypothetical protein